MGLMVGRDVHDLDEGGVARAVTETVAESSSDGIVAPLFYLALGGPPLALAYKAVNTLDSMIGHRDRRYRYLGRVAARLDDLLNFVPARLGALVLCAVAGQSWQAALTIWLRDGFKTASPNAGQTMACAAGALGVRLEKEGQYVLGAHSRLPAASDIGRARRLVARAIWVAAALALLARIRD